MFTPQPPPAGPGPASTHRGHPQHLLARIAEAERENWLGEVEGLKVSLAGAEQKLAQLNQRARLAATVNLGTPTFRDVAGRTISVDPNKIIN